MKMKNIKIIYRALLFVSVIILSACEDFLNTPPVDSLGVDGFYSTPKQGEQGVMGVYALLRQLSSSEFRLLSEMRSDNVWANPEPNGGFRDYSELSNFRAQPSLDAVNNVWNQWYQVIYNANTVLGKLTGVQFSNETFRNQLLGELYFLRGWAYFELVRLYGNIPVVTVPVGAEEAANTPQTAAKDVYANRVLPDLMEAKRLLPPEKDLKNEANASATETGRAGKIAATAMLGRVYMTMAGFPLNDDTKKSLAKAELKEVIDFSEANGNKFWAPDSTEWRKQWISDNNNKYSIFAIQYRLGVTGNPAISEMSDEWPETFSKHKPGIATEGWIEKTLAYEFTREYTYRDKDLVERTRKDARGFGHTLYIPDWPADFPAPNWGAAKAKEPLLGDVTVDGATLKVVTNAYIYKYFNSIIKRAELGYDNIDDRLTARDHWPVNYPVIRYEDVLLMYAEILAGEGANGDGSVNTTTALGIVNKIRERAGCTPETNAAKTMDFIKRERRVELAVEGVRWFDLVRWNEWKQAITDMFDRYGNPQGASKSNIMDGRHLYPIPEKQDNVKPGFYTQNPGY
jgi:hypothetical protein